MHLKLGNGPENYSGFDTDITSGFGSVYMKLWNTLTTMAREPHPQISQMANDIINYISNQVRTILY